MRKGKHVTALYHVRWDSQDTFNSKDTTHATSNRTARIPSMRYDNAPSWLKSIGVIPDNASVVPSELVTCSICSCHYHFHLLEHPFWNEKR
jgi:hypothetical protein